MALFERDDELSLLHSLLAESSRGKGQIVLLSGAVGIGKTELLYAFGEQATDAGAQFVVASGRDTGLAGPFDVVRQLFADLALPAELRDRLSGPGGGEDQRQTRARLAHDLCEALLGLAARRPVLIGVDDVHRADGSSMGFLLRLVRRIRSAPVMLVLNEPRHTRRDHPVFDTELLRQRHYRRLQLPPLSRQGVTRLLTEGLDPAEAQRLAPECHAISGGNPLLVRALLEDHRELGGARGLRTVQEPHDILGTRDVRDIRDVPDDPVRGRAAPDPGAPGGPVAGDSFGQAVLACLRRGEPGMLDVGRALAVLGDASSPARVARLLGTGADPVVRVLRQLDAAGLLDLTRFRHPVARAAVLGDVPPERLRDLRLGAAGLLHREGAASTDVARHLVAVGHVDDRWVLPVLKEAAEQARLSDDIPLAVSCLELASLACSDAVERAGLTAALARAETRVNPSVAARHLVPLADAACGGALPDTDVFPLVKALLWHGRGDEAAAVARRLCEAPGSAGAPAALGSVRAWLRVSHPPLLDRIPPRGACRTGPPPYPGAPRADALLASVLSGEPDRGAAMNAEQLIRSTRLDDTTFDEIESALLTLLHTDRLGRAALWSGRLLAEATARCAPAWQARLAAVRAETALRYGDLPTARRLAESALTHVSPRGWGTAVGAPLATLVLAHTAMGDAGAAEEQTRHPLPEGVFRSRTALPYLYARGHQRLGAHHVHAALDDFLLCGRLARDWGLDLPSLAPWRSGAAAAHLVLGRREEAHRLAEEEVERSGPGTSRSRGMSLRLLAESGEPPRRAALLQEAVRVLRLCGDRLELARALARLSQAQHELDQAGKGRKALYQALQLAERCSARSLQQSLLSADPGGRPLAAPAAFPDSPRLSAAEQRVARLAALGHSNREIADRLCITVSTVEQHLTRVYRKLNVANRADLPSEFHLVTAHTA
ncbi:ATP-binding protein [Streptomyces sp. DT24]|uniref:ATP-binding protein n=1 Tax=unclassified Streptomyces TaxID=2593676 RepID=UPI003CE738E7